MSSGISLIVADAIVIAVTWLKTYRHVKRASQPGSYVTLSKSLLRDGKRTHSDTEYCKRLMQLVHLQGSVYFMYSFLNLLIVTKADAEYNDTE